jgi:DnaJ-class molecular chaperone
MTHYDTLGVSESASPDEVKTAYRKLANQHHPDKGGDTNKFQQIQAAYDAIGNEQSRAQYDAERRGHGGFKFTVNGQDVSGNGVPPEMEDMLRNFGFGFSFGPGFANQGDPFAQFRQPRRNKDIQVEVAVTLASTLDAQIKTVLVQGTNGERYTVDVQIPRGVRPNSTIKYPTLGDNFFSSLARGDLYVRINVEGDPRFHVDNLDLITHIEIDCVRAMVGNTITVQGLDNKKFDLAIPPGTQPNTKFRIPQQGLYAMNQTSRGNFVIHVTINVPANLSEQQHQSLKDLFHIQ